MPSVNAADRNRAQELLAKTREEFQSKEVETNKKHKEEMQKQAQKFENKIRHLEESYNSQIGTMKDKNRQYVTDRDKDYQSRIETLQDLNRKQTKETAEKNERERKALVGAFRADARKAQEVETQQSEALRASYGKQLEDKDTHFQNFAERVRKVSDESAKKQLDNMRTQHEEQIGLLSEGRDEKIRQVVEERDEWKRAKDSQIKQISRQSESERNRLLTGFETNIKEERRAHLASLDHQRDGYREGLKEIRGRYNDALAEKRERDFHSSEEFKTKTSEQVDSDIQRLKKRIQELEQQITYDRVDNNRKTAQQLKNQAENYQNELDVYRNQKENMIGSFNDLKKRNMRDLSKRSAEQIHDTNRFYQQKMDTLEVKQKEEMEQQRRIQAGQLDHVKNRSEARYQRLLADTEASKERLNSFYSESLKQNTENLEDKIKEERLNNITEQNDSLARMHKQMQVAEQNYLDKLTKTVGHYQTQLESQRSTSRRDLMRQKEQDDMKLKQLQKASEMAIISQKTQHELQVEKIREKHQQDLDAMKSRHDAEIAQLLVAKKGTDMKDKGES